MMTLGPSEMGWGPVSVAEGERRVVGVVWGGGPEGLVVEVRYGGLGRVVILESWFGSK